MPPPLPPRPQHSDIVVPPPLPSVAGTSPPRRSRRGAWIGLSTLGVVTLIAAGATFAQGFASDRFDATAANLREAIAQASDARTALHEQRDIEDARIDSALDVRSADRGVLTSDEQRLAFDEIAATSTATLADVERSTTAPLPAIAEKPFWFWEMLTQADRMASSADQVRASTEEHRDLQQQVDAAGEALEEAAFQLLEGAIAQSASFEEDYVSSRNAEMILLRLARDLASDVVETRGDEVEEAFGELQTAAEDVIDSHAEVMASKAGPRLDIRLEIEDYARSLAGGVLLEFEWKRIVNGAGTGGTAGGTATWSTGNGYGGYSTITLSESVVEMWPQAEMKALVTHEVGHAISAKCYEMFDWRDRDANEEWATAWALSMGHTADGNGVSLYGYPRQEIIDKAATCR